MNRKQRKLLFIRSKNAMRAKGYTAPKWVLQNHKWPTIWDNAMPGLFEDAWVIDMLRHGA